MATIGSIQARYLGNVNGLPPKMVGGLGMLNIQEAATQTFGAGAVVRPDDTSGQIEIAPNADNVASLFGIAFEDASGITADAVLIRLFQPGDIYALHYEASGTGGVTALALIGDPVGFNIDSGILKCDKNGFAVTKPFGVVRNIFSTAYGFDPGPLGDALGDTNGRVVVELQPGAYWMQSA